MPLEHTALPARTAALLFLCLLALLVSGCASKETPAQEEEPLSLVVDDDTKSELDLVVMVKTSPFFDVNGQASPSAFRKNIDGKLTLASEDAARDIIYYNNCYLGDWRVNDNTSAIYEAYGERYSIYLQVNELYSANGADKPAAATFTFLEQYFEDQDRDIRISRLCQDDQPFKALKNYERKRTEILVAPRFLHKTIANFLALKDRDIEFEVLQTIKFDDIQQRSAAIVAEENTLASDYTALWTRYTQLAQKQEQNTLGALLVGANTKNRSFEPDDTYNQGDSFYTQQVCALEQQGIDEFAVRGYRNLNGEMLPPSLQKQYRDYTDRTGKAIRFERADGEPLLQKQFKTLDDAYRNFLSYDHSSQWQVSDADCHVFIGFPADLVKLRRALNEQEVSSNYARLIPANELREQWARSSGFESFDEYQFATSFDKLNWAQLRALRGENINTPETYEALEAEIVQSGYGDEADLSAALAVQYLQDRKRAADTQADAIAIREQRAAEEARQQKAAAERRKQRQQQRAREYPYEALLACEFQGNHTNLVACFSGGEYEAETTLELTNGDQYRLYKFYDIDALGTGTRSGIAIDLRDSFTIKAQNSSGDLLLTLTIRKRSTGEVVFQKSAAQYGVISVSN